MTNDPEEPVQASESDRLKYGRYVTNEFIQELYRRTEEHYFKAARYKRGGQRFRKDVTADPVFRAIHRCRKQHEGIEHFGNLERTGLPHHLLPGTQNAGFRQMEKIAFRYLHERAVKQYDPRAEAFVASEYVNAVKAGNISRLKELVKFSKIAEKAIRIDEDYIAQPVPWHFYFGMGAFQFLKNGIVPNKKQVKEAAITCRVGDEIRAVVERAIANNGKRREQGIDLNGIFKEKIELLQSLFDANPPKVNTTRIYRELGLSGLPSAPRHL